MRKLIDIPNVDGASSDYPKGRIRNKNNAVAPPVVGTPIVEELYGDIVQFFHRLVSLGGVTENDLPDNVTNGYQLFEAAVKALNGGLLTKHIDISGWNMTEVASITINAASLGVSNLANIKTWQCLVYGYGFGGVLSEINDLIKDGSVRISYPTGIILTRGVSFVGSFYEDNSNLRATLTYQHLP